MATHLLHIFRNTPFGRETLLQSCYFSKQLGIALVVYIPEFTKFLMYFENDVVQIDLDHSYLTSPRTARDHAQEILEATGADYSFLDPKHFTASSLPDVPTNFEFMCCPRSISDLSSKIGLGYIGPKVRRIVRSARFPVLITGTVFKPWERIAVFFGGSANAVNALKLGVRIGRMTKKPLDVYTYLEGNNRNLIQQTVEEEKLEADMEAYVENWHFFDKGPLQENLYAVPHDALVVAGAFGHGLIRSLVFGSKLEKIQSVLPNPMLIVGPKYSATL
jgi:nucleotide-binding universal stress UspA family protein